MIFNVKIKIVVVKMSYMPRCLYDIFVKGFIKGFFIGFFIFEAYFLRPLIIIIEKYFAINICSSGGWEFDKKQF